MSNKRDKKIQATMQLVKSSAEAKPKRIHTPVTLSFQHCNPGDTFCLSYCQKAELKDIVDCLRQLGILSWQQVLEQGCKSGQFKVGLAYTPYPNDALRCVTNPLGEDVRVGGL